jgi:hypothetical protein
VLWSVSPSSKRACSVDPEYATDTTGRRVRRTTPQERPPSSVAEIVPCGRQPKARLSAQAIQPVPASPILGVLNATAFGTSATRPTELPDADAPKLIVISATTTAAILRRW